MATQDKLLEVNNLKVHFPIKGGLIPKTVGHVKAVDGVNFHINAGETLGLVGESGCGKSTTGRAILRLVRATEGQVLFEGTNVLDMTSTELQKVREKMQFIFQDPFASLNPRMSIGKALEEVLYVHRMGDQAVRRAQVVELMDMVGLSKRYLKRYPHEFSGGQRQRIVIARALAVKPQLVICDEPVSALDVSIQAQIINLMEELQDTLKLTFLFIAHDLSVVRHISDRIAVMYLGKIVEIAEKHALFDSPQHPYTQALLSAIPTCDVDEKKEKIILGGEIPSPENPPSGCRFRTRCPHATDLCSQQDPQYKDLGDGHQVACHLV